MSQTKSYYQLSLDADRDIEEIFDYTEKEFGFNKAVAYVEAFEPLFENLLSNPSLGRKRDEIKIGLRSILKAEHVIFYRVLEDHIRIVRVLHGSRDLPKFFKVE